MSGDLAELEVEMSDCFDSARESEPKLAAPLLAGVNISEPAVLVALCREARILSCQHSIHDVCDRGAGNNERANRHKAKAWRRQRQAETFERRLLSRLEPVVVTEENRETNSYGTRLDHYNCPACGRIHCVTQARFCPWCGKPLVWRLEE